jgi:hypothetical protein
MARLLAGKLKPMRFKDFDEFAEIQAGHGIVKPWVSSSLCDLRIEPK